MNAIEVTNQVLTAMQTLVPLAERLVRLVGRLGLRSPLNPAVSYENLSLDLTLDLIDVQGRRAVVTRKQRVQFLVGDASTIMVPVWGTGNQTKRYEVTGAKRLGFQPDGPRQVQMLAIDRRRQADVRRTFKARRTIENGFTARQEYFETTVERPTRRLALKVCFPKGRPPNEISIVTTPEGQAQAVRPKLGADGRARVVWSIKRPKPQTLYSLRWAW